MYINRAGETGEIPNRSKRFFRQHEVWFFHTREGADIGPFESADEAQKGLEDFIEFLNLADPKTLSSFYRSLNSASEAQGA